MKTKGIIPGFGAKRLLAPLIGAQLGSHRAYWEPFCGSLAVLLAKAPSAMETANDVNPDLVNLVRVLQDDVHGPWLYRRLRRTWAHEDLFRASLEALQAEACPGEPWPFRAYHFFVVSWMGRSGVAGTPLRNSRFCPNYGVRGGSPGDRFASAVQSIPAWRRRLRRVTVLRREAFDLLPRIHDTAGIALYCDPPYLGTGGRYARPFTAADHALLARLLRRFQRTRVVVSAYERPELLDLYPRWTRIRCPLPRALGDRGQRGAHSPPVPEILLVNGPSFSF